jgi:D-amino-acid dehydrogenase
VIGVCCAYFLAKRGIEVAVLERHEIGQGASYGNAGVVAPGHAPINKPGRIGQAVRSLVDPLSPLYVAPRFDPALAGWLWRFSRTCTERHLEFVMRTLGPLGHATSQLFDELVQEEQLSCGYKRQGYYEVYLTVAGLDGAIKEAGWLRSFGYYPEILSGSALREREPALNGRVAGGVFHSAAATMNPYRFVRELADRAQRLGATFRTGTEVSEVLVTGHRVKGVRTVAGEVIEADVVVLAPGAYGARLVRMLGLKLPQQAAKGYHLDCKPADASTPCLRQACVLGEKLVFCTPMDGFVRFAGTLELSGVNHQIRRPRLEQLAAAAKRYLLGDQGWRPFSEWCGLRPCLPDGLPAVGPVAACDGLYIATGHAMQGLTLGPITGRLVSDYVVDGKPSLDVGALRPDRF